MFGAFQIIHRKNSFNIFILLFFTKIVYKTLNKFAEKSTNYQFHTFLGPQTSTRERCDSLTLTRTRTNSDSSTNTFNSPQLQSTSHQNGNMPPPKKIPNRPISNIYNQRSSPTNNSPLSPPSYSESDGSSVSIDETDFPHQMTPDDHVYLPMK